MSGGSSKSSSRTTNTTNNRTINASLDGESPVSVIDSEGVEIYQTDYDSISKSFDLVESALDDVRQISAASSKSVGDAYDDATQLVNSQVGIVSDLAKTLKIGDTESIKWLMIAVVIAVVVIFVAFFWSKR